jgi:methylenetetrahydrofolate dehydrogenase (NADP+)/methenyltetrahydrofolate cyclohydrolase
VPASILDGRALAADLRTELFARTNLLRERGLAPKLAIVFVGENESSLAYVRNLARTGERAGIGVVVSHLPANASVEEVRAELEKLRHAAAAAAAASFHPRNRRRNSAA